MNNQNPAATTPATLTVLPAVPTNGKALISKAGIATGHEYYLGTKTAKELKEQFQAAGFKGNDLKAKVNEALGNEASARKIAAYAFIEYSHKEKGLLPDVAQLRKSTGNIKLVSGGVATDSLARKEAEELKKQNDLLLAERFEMKAQFDAMQEQLAKLTAAKPAELPLGEPKRK